MRGNWLLFFVFSVISVFTLSSLLLFIPNHSFPFCYWLSFPSHLSLPFFTLLSSSIIEKIVKSKDKMVRIGEQRTTVEFFFFISSFELSLHLNYADDKKEVAVSIHIVLKLQDSFLAFSPHNEDFVGLWTL